MNQELHAEWRKHQPTTRSIEKRLAEVAFKRADLKTDGRVAATEKVSSTEDRTKVRCCNESSERLRRKVGDDASAFAQGSLPNNGRRCVGRRDRIGATELMEPIMPFLRLTIQPAPDADTASRLTMGLTDLMANTLGKKAALTSVLVETPAHAHWTIGTVPVIHTAMLEAIITEGTNDAAQKSAFVGAANSLLRAELTGLAPVAYVVVKEIPAENWGYDGRTQLERRNAAMT